VNPPFLILSSDLHGKSKNVVDFVWNSMESPAVNSLIQWAILAQAVVSVSY
jgi:GTP:adenosylcobinamide-phosphate guanylyltransferase